MTSSSCPRPPVPWAGGPFRSLSCRPGGGWGPSGEGAGGSLHLHFPQRPALCIAQPPPVPTPCPQGPGRRRHYLSPRSCQLRDRSHGQPLRGDRRSCVRLELAVGSGGAPFTSDSSCCSQPEDRGAGGVCSPGPLAQGCSQTLSTVTLWGGACTTRENGGQRSKLTYSGSQAVGGGVRLHLSLPGDDGRPNHLLKHHPRASG